MAKARPLYSVEEQYNKLDTDIGGSFPTLNIIRFRLLMACSNAGTLAQAKNRFLNLIQDTEIKTLFSSVLEIPEIRETQGVNAIQQIHTKFKSQFDLFPKALRELSVLGVPQMTRVLMETYYYSNQDPVYKLSILASMVMMGYLRDDAINNRKE